jgi:tRNA U34 5-methylaminomethyl-2-thiouridine-forming methyltransferase MnmC
LTDIPVFKGFDVVFHDPFSSQRNAELWTVDLFKNIYRSMNPQGIMLTYSTAMPVRAGLAEAGFHIGTVETSGKQREGTIAALDDSSINHPISVDGIPYRDPTHTSTNKTILKQRELAR